jgi:hypothetical protein
MADQSLSATGNPREFFWKRSLTAKGVFGIFCLPLFSSVPPIISQIPKTVISIQNTGQKQEAEFWRPTFRVGDWGTFSFLLWMLLSASAWWTRQEKRPS